MPRPITEADTPYTYIQTSPIITTSTSSSIGMLDSSTGTIIQSVNLEQYNVGMYSTFTGTPTPPDVYVFGTLTFTSDEYISNFGFNDANVVLTRNIIRNMLAANDSVFVEGKMLSDYSIDTTKVNSNTVTVMTFVTVAIIPLAFVAAGVIVYNKRKNL